MSVHMTGENEDQERRSERLELRATPSQAEVIDRAAETAGKSRSAFMLDVATLEAERILADRTVFLADDEAFEEFLRMLNRPPRVIPELVELFRRPPVWDEAD